MLVGRSRPVDVRPRLDGRAPPRGLELGVVAVALLAVTAFWALVPTYPALDSYYALVWGREAFHGHTPTFEGYRAPTHHPLWVLVGGLLSLAGDDADRLLVLVTLWCLVLFLWGLYRLGAAQFGAWVGLAAAVFGASSFAFLLYAVRAFVDVPFLAAVVWAGVLAVRGPARSGVGAMGLLFVAGLLRPEAWLLAALWWLWTVRRASPHSRVALTALFLGAPVLWLALDLAVTGDPLSSFTATSSLADELRHSGGAAQVPGALVGYIAGTIRTPVALLGLAGVALAWWRYGPRRIAVPLALLLAGIATFVIAGLAGFSLIQRYLTVPAAALCLFAGYALLGFTTVPRGDRVRVPWTRIAAVIGSVGVVAAIVLAATSVGRVRTELRFVRDSHDDLVAILRTPAVRAGRRCGPITLPTDRLVPDTRWILDAPRLAVLARSAPGRRPYGVELFVSGTRALSRFGFAAGIPARTNLPDPGYHLVARNRTFDAWVRCPAGRAHRAGGQ
jgi:hypothetical protein